MVKSMNARPKYHFTPRSGWINDPNGTICIDGKYHLFYQHYPMDIVWGPMHWGHATSTDLINWNHEEIALFPDEDGYIFSGSCVLDEENVSGFGQDGIKPLIAIYTSHDPVTGYQQQCIAYSLDYIHFTKYEGNPVIANTRELRGQDYDVDFRDPKVFRNPVRGGYSMVLAVGRIIDFYHSDNLINWTKTGSFDPSINGYYGICECPDCFVLSSDDVDKWILSISSILEDDMVGKSIREKGFNTARVMQYFVGEFDGDTFIDTEKYDRPLILDYGTDNYAMVTFADAVRPLAMGWGEHWDYVMKSPLTGHDGISDSYRGKMTLARELTLVKTASGYRVAQNPVVNSADKTKQYYFSMDDILGGKARINLPDCDNALLSICVEEDKISVRRRSFLKEDNYNTFTYDREISGDCDILVCEDQGYYEIFADGGLGVFSIMTYN